MEKKIKISVLLLVAYLCVFFIGFKSGDIHSRMQKKAQFEKIEVPVRNSFIIVEKRKHENYESTTFEQVDGSDTRIVMLKNERLRPLLSLRDIKIFNEHGEQIY